MTKPSLNLFNGGPHDDATGNTSSWHQRSTTPTRSARQTRELDRIAGVAEPKTVAISVRTLVPLLIEASQKNRTWLRDFADDTVTVDADLYDVLLAYQQIGRRQAG